MKFTATNQSRLRAQVIVDYLEKQGITQYYISPGMRNAPLIWAIKENKNAKYKTVLDERTASYMALGYAKTYGRPAVLTCTSGTALANYYPAIIEASHTRTGIVVLSADRPPALVSQGTNQTINQIDIYNEYVVKSIPLSVPTNENVIVEVENRLIDLASNLKEGPVHINQPFDTPLDATKTNLDSIQSNTDNTCRSFINDIATSQIDPIIITECDFIVVGELNYSERNSVTKILTETKTDYFTDISSGLKYDNNNVAHLMNYLREYKPQNILHLGGRVTAKKYNNYIEEETESFTWITNNRRLQLSPKTKGEIIHLKDFTNIDKYVQLNLENEAKKVGYPPNDMEEILAFDIVADGINHSLEPYTNLFIGNSTVIRIFDGLKTPLVEDINIITNRGASGIEGNISTSLGIFDASKKPTISIMGDMSFLHDQASLMELCKYQENILIIVINNNGGKIFDYLKMEGKDELLPIMTSKQKSVLAKIIEAHGICYQRCDSISHIKETISNFYTNNQTQVIEIFIDDDLTKKRIDKMGLIT